MCRAVTVAPGITAPVASRTIPEIAAVDPWPKTRQLPIAINPTIAVAIFTCRCRFLLMTSLPLKESRLQKMVRRLVMRGNYVGVSRFVKKSVSTNCLLVFMLCTAMAHAQSPAPARTVLDGVFSEAQAKRGQAAYAAHCSVCHGDALDGVSAPELTGNRFLERWREDTLDTIYNYIKDNMPLNRAPDAPRIPESDYLDILTHILNVNGYRSGAAELTPALMGKVMLVGKNGPQPVPDGSLVITVGCLSQSREG